MTNRSLLVKSWVVLLAAIASWGGVGIFSWQLQAMQSEHARFATEAAAANLEQGEAALRHALVRDTIVERAALERATGLDVLAAVNTIESVISNDVAVQVTGAQTEKSIPTKEGVPPINVVTLIAHAEGSFSALMHILQMIETLPLATTVLSVEFSRVPVDSQAKFTEAPWALTVRLRFLTTTALSS